jgi:DNA polymerase III delta prime subunit
MNSMNNILTHISIDDLKIDSSIKKYFKHCIKTENYTNMLFYGNPGTGKTTSSLVFINTYIRSVLEKYPTYTNYNKKNSIEQELKRSILSLNTSVYRNTSDFFNTIKEFVESNSMFSSEQYKKIIVLDEIDYMTQQGQHCLIQLIKKYNNVLFICMCNYVSKLIDELKTYFLIFNYNCFGSIVKDYVIQDNDYITISLLDYILCDSDIREYINEKERISILSKDTKIKLLNFIIDSIDDIYTELTSIETYVLKSNTVTVFNSLNKIKKRSLEFVKLTGIQHDKLLSIIYQHVANKINISNEQNLSNYKNENDKNENDKNENDTNDIKYKNTIKMFYDNIIMNTNNE